MSPDVQMQALHDVVQAGYVRYIGMSTCYAYQCTLVSFHTHADIHARNSPPDAEYAGKPRSI
jgi:aryl-alcohol dehydrogenase-like predicted oxidoreductase